MTVLDDGGMAENKLAELECGREGKSVLLAVMREEVYSRRDGSILSMGVDWLAAH